MLESIGDLLYWDWYLIRSLFKSHRIGGDANQGIGLGRPGMTIPAAQTLPLRKVLLRHPVQRRSDEFPIRFEKAHRKSRLRHFDSLRTILEHSRVVHRVVVRDSL